MLTTPEQSERIERYYADEMPEPPAGCRGSWQYIDRNGDTHSDDRHDVLYARYRFDLEQWAARQESNRVLRLEQRARALGDAVDRISFYADELELSDDATLNSIGARLRALLMTTEEATP